MGKLVCIDRRARAGFYEPAYPGQPRFLVLPHETGVVALQLDASAKRRAFTFATLGRKPIGKGFWACDPTLLSDATTDVLAPFESPIGSLVGNDAALVMQVVDNDGRLVPFLFPLKISAQSVGLAMRKACRWAISTDGKPGGNVRFRSHPRAADPQIAAFRN